jgi:hypothetical protein
MPAHAGQAGGFWELLVTVSLSQSQVSRDCKKWPADQYDRRAIWGALRTKLVVPFSRFFTLDI